MKAIPNNEQKINQRLYSIDALRGMVMMIMLIDHVRETFYLHQQVSDPMVIAETPPDLFFSRLLAHFCAPIFVFLTGLSAWLYGSKKQNSRIETSKFLLTRGLFLILLELTVINFAWTFTFPPERQFLQVIWAIGLSMIFLSLALWLPRKALLALGVILVAGHNLLDNLHLAPEHPFYELWTILHDRGWIEISETLRARISYPLLPWLGVIVLGYLAGCWFSQQVSPDERASTLQNWGLGTLTGFMALRLLNIYGDTPWSPYDTTLQTLMSFLNVTKYPPSLLFILLTLGTGLLLLNLLEKKQHSRAIQPLVAFGGAPMFYYILHLYVLKLLYLIAVNIWGLNQGDYYGFNHFSSVWIMTLGMLTLLYPVVKQFSIFKARRKDLRWLKYF